MHQLGEGAEAMVLAKKLKNKLHQKVLFSLAETEVGYYITFNAIALSTGIPQSHVRKIVRRLKRQGLAEYCTGLINEDGQLLGSGHSATDIGRVVAKLIEEDKK